MSDLVLGDTCCKSEAFKIYEKSLNSILFSSDAQKYCIILNLNASNIISSLIINKEINIINPTELKSSESPTEYICENYLIFNDTKCPNNLSLVNDFERLGKKYLEKCTSEINYITSNFTCNNFINKTFEFSFKCSEKYPYEIVATHKCVEYCDENDLSTGLCILNYHNSNNINITENIINTELYEVLSTQSDIISTEIEYKDIITYSKETILETRNIESDSSISSRTNLINTSKDTIFETENKESDSSISSRTNLITASKDTIMETENKESDSSISSNINLITNSVDLSNYLTINKLTNTNIFEYTIISSSVSIIYDLLNDILNDKLDNNINFIENIHNIF